MMNQLRGRLAAEAAAAAASEAVTAVGAAASAASEDSHNIEEVILHSYAKFPIIQNRTDNGHVMRAFFKNITKIWPIWADWLKEVLAWGYFQTPTESTHFAIVCP